MNIRSNHPKEKDASDSLHKRSKKNAQRNKLHVEAIIHQNCIRPLDQLRGDIEKFVITLGQKSLTYSEGPVDLVAHNAPAIIKQCCLLLSLHPEEGSNSVASWTVSNFQIHPYMLTDTPPEPEEIEENGEDPITVCEALQLPHTSLHTAWDNLVLPKNIKSNLLSYAQTALMFSTKNVSPHIVSWNRVLLLYGPPGTGKTTLCRALAQKLSIRSMHSFPSGGYLLEIKSHSLFSKWFSESGKLISRLFARIKEMVEDEPDAVFCVLVDEIESLASRRTSNGSGVEPSDAVRAVNSLLTSLDSIRKFPNVLVLSTSNITDCVDDAFVDRVDWMVEIGLPCAEARYEILRSCVQELVRVGILNRHSTEEDGFDLLSYTQAVNMKVRKQDVPSEMLLDCANFSEGLSGRALRKLPLQSHAFGVHGMDEITVSEFLIALKTTIQRKVKRDI